MTNNANIGRVEILNRAWADNEFMTQLENEPKRALKTIGATIPDNVNVKVVRDSGNVRYIHIPRAPTENELNDAELLNANAGTAFFCASIVVTLGAASIGGSIGASIATTT